LALTPHGTPPSRQVFFSEFLGAPAAAQQRAAALLVDPTNAELRDGVLLFLERHVKKLVAQQHPKLIPAFRELVRRVDSGAA
jgi:hypothetical protein